MCALRCEHPRKMTGCRSIYHSIALELAYTLMLKSRVQFTGSKVMAKNVSFSECEKMDFFTFAGFAGRSLRSNLARVARLDAF